MTREAIKQDLISLRVKEQAAHKAAWAIEIALSEEPVNTAALPHDTSELLGLVRAPSMAPSDIHKRAAKALEFGEDAARSGFGDLGQLPTNYLTQRSLPKVVEGKNYDWVRICTGGTGNLGYFVPSKPKTPEAWAIRRWFEAQTTVPFYGGYWWEAADMYGFEGMDSMAQSVTAARDIGLSYPNSCGDAMDINREFMRMSGPRMWAFVSAVAPYETWHPKRDVCRRFRCLRSQQAKQRELRENAAQATRVTYTPAD